MILDYSEYSFTNYLDVRQGHDPQPVILINAYSNIAHICRAMKSRKDDVAGNDFSCGLPGYR